MLVILGLLLSMLLSLIQQLVFTGRFLALWVFRVLSFGEMLSFDVPLIIFFVAFFLSIRQKPAP